MNSYSYVVTCTSMPSLMADLERILSERPYLGVDAISFSHPDLWELRQGKLQRLNNYVEICFYTHGDLTAEQQADLEKQLGAEEEAQEPPVEQLPVGPAQPIDSLNLPKATPDWNVDYVIKPVVEVRKA